MSRKQTFTEGVIPLKNEQKVFRERKGKWLRNSWLRNFVCLILFRGIFGLFNAYLVVFGLFLPKTEDFFLNAYVPL